MSNYVKATNFTSKDALAIGNPLKIIKGTEFDVEFNAIASAITSKEDSTAVASALALKANTTDVNVALALKAPLASPTLTGTPTAPTASVNTNTTQVATTAFVVAQIADDAPTKTGTGASGTWGIGISGNAATATTATTAATATNVTNALGIGQTWQNVVGSRTSGTWYQNTTSLPIFVFVQLSTTGDGMYINSSASDSGAILVAFGDGDSGEWKTFFTIVPVNQYYKTTGGSVRYWSELR